MIAIYKEIVFIALPAALILAGILGYLVSKGCLSPYRNITKTAQAIRTKILKQRIAINRKDELENWQWY